MLETLSGDGISSVLLVMGVCTATRAVTGNLDTHTPCKYPAATYWPLGAPYPLEKHI